MVMPRTNLVFRRFVVTCCRVVLLSWVIACSPARAQVPEKSCDGFLLPPRQVKGKAVGPTSCLMQETGATYEGRALTRLDVGLDGTVEGLERYDLLMVSKGYALVKTRRTSTERLGEIITTLEDGSTVDYAAFNDTVRYIMDFADVAKKIVADRLGQPPSRVYLYGHSAGARIGHATNYAPGLNVGRDGTRFFDGILGDDPAAGTWYPVVMKAGRDVLLSSDADKAAFVPEIDVAHQMDNNIWEPKHPGWMSDSYLENKRNNARILRDKGIAKYRMYEVRGVS